MNLKKIIMFDPNTKEGAVFIAAANAYRRLAGFRTRRARMKDYAYGRQWNDPVTDPVSGEKMTEGEMVMKATGHEPMTNNMIRQMVKTIIGRFRNMRSHEGRQERGDIARIYEFNRLDELDSRAFEEFLMSGCTVQRVVAECRRDGVVGRYVDNVSPADFFINEVSDPRGCDTELVGMLHDMSLADVEMRFGNNNPTEIKKIERVYSTEGEMHRQTGDFIGGGVITGADISRFFRSPTGRCRVIEVWTLESCRVARVFDPETARYSEVVLTPTAEAELREEETRRNERGRESLRISHTRRTAWHGRFYAPDGTLLGHCGSQLGSGSHPFAFKFYPLIDGEVHSFVEDIVDQQRQINRLLNLADHIMSTAAKGVLMFPTRSKPDFVSWREIARRWAVCGSIIPYEPTGSGDAPRQVTSSGLDAGVTGLLDTQMKLIRDISGVGSVISGGNGLNGAGADSLAVQVDNATIALNDLFATFTDFIERRDAKATELPAES